LFRGLAFLKKFRKREWRKVKWGRVRHEERGRSQYERTGDDPLLPFDRLCASSGGDARKKISAGIGAAGNLALVKTGKDVSIDKAEHGRGASGGSAR